MLNRENTVLKSELLATGMDISDRAYKEILSRDNMRPLTLADFASTSGVTLHVNNDFYVNVPISKHNSQMVISPKYTLDIIDSNLYITCISNKIPATPLPTAQYNSERNGNGIPYSDFAITHVDRVRVSPIYGCAFDCHFCDHTSRSSYQTRLIDNFIDSIHKALIDPVLPARHILISGGTPHPQDYKYLENSIEEICKSFPDIPIDVMAIPDSEVLDFKKLHKHGVNQLSLNIEIFDNAISSKLMPAKSEHIQEYRFHSLENAVDVFGRGNVRSILIFGLEPFESTLKGVEKLLSIGVQPVLSPFRPDPRSRLSHYPSPTAAEVVKISQEANRLATEAGMSIGPDCEMCRHNVIG